MGDTTFRVFGLDRMLYGPVPVATLAEWVQDGRVQAGTWIHAESGDTWHRATEVPELKAFFASSNPDPPAEKKSSLEPGGSRVGVPTKALQRLRVFTEMTAEQLEPFARAMVEETFRPFAYIVRQGNHGDAMYFVIQGKVGISTKGQVAESFLVGLNIGETFGEMSLFDPGPRSADVRAENDVVVLKLTVQALQGICSVAPAAANKFLWNVARLLAGRVRSMDKRTATAKDMDVAGRAIGDPGPVA